MFCEGIFMGPWKYGSDLKQSCHHFFHTGISREENMPIASKRPDLSYPGHKSEKQSKSVQLIYIFHKYKKKINNR